MRRLLPRRAWIAAAWLALTPCLAPTLAHAVEPDEVLPDAALEVRARAISSELRCLVCQNQSIDDSHAPLARDLRLLVRERLVAGENDAAVERYLVARYGDFVLLKPPLKASTALLWGMPFLILVAGGAGLGMIRWRAGTPRQTQPLSPDEEAALVRALQRGTAREL